ncbi:TetR family transcriptional regulator [Terracoccus sp. 273MFTsu3.1]|uniref:TetR family transcriptional regulator n=1 Tax=Terracoccus sp. 273MFTsu3.1 TaxID=1172188 RepID=UPI00037A7467|nr:TetR family transcriptional regulator [Terracoccus sp. 273MFTsu3.1]
MALSREQVVATAVDLLRRYGLGDLSMRRLARELGVAPGALYWHVANKQELLVEVADVLLAEIPPPADGRPPAEALVGLAVAVRDALVHVPDAADVVGLAYAVEPSAARALRDLARLVHDAGAPASERDEVAALVVHHILGSVAGQQDRALAASVDPDLPTPDATTEAKAFEVGLSVIVRGLGGPRQAFRTT